MRIVAVHRGRNFQERLSAMGIQAGDVVQVIRRQDQGAVVIAKENSRYALGGGMAFKIHVSKET